VTPTAAVTSDEVDFADWNGPVTPADVFGDVRIRATAFEPGTAVFIGVAAKSDVDRYLAGVSYAVVTEWDPFETSPRAGAGGSPSTPPDQVDIWTARTSGVGPQTLTWRPSSTDWVAVVMNQSGRPGVAVTADAGASVPYLVWFAVGFFIAGGLLLVGVLALIIVPIRRASRRDAASATA
jgi:hypothetical protein